jgi:tetratricopeptide (TPR) repeat protein
MKDLLTVCLLLICTTLLGQTEGYPFPALSPKGHLSQVVGNTLIEIDYERPAVRQRVIFGELVPWNQLWRTGAGKCTRISFDKPVEIRGNLIEAGTYSLFTIPNQQEWMVILNRDTTQYGTHRYNQELDVARFLVLPEHSERFYEALTIDLDFVPDNAIFYLSWSNTRIHFTIETTTQQEVTAFIDRELWTGKNPEADLYVGAADYYLTRKSNLYGALELVRKGLEIDPDNGWGQATIIRIYEALQLYPEALEEVQKAQEKTRNATFEKEEYRQQEMEFWQRMEERIRTKQAAGQ